MSNIDENCGRFIFCSQNFILMERKKREIILCIQNPLCIKIICVFNSIKGVKTCVRLPCGNRIISHASSCKVVKQSATVVKGKHYYLIPAYDFHETSYASR